jgi:hypothetical protein
MRGAAEHKCQTPEITMSKIRYPLHGTLAILALLASSPVSSDAIKEIEEASAEAREALAASSGLPPAGGVISTARLEAALKRGEEINASLQSEVEALKIERAQLVQVQTTLTSGLIGAIVTALVAIGGAIMGSRNSRPDRDLKRLAVLEKARELQSAGIRLPDDIADAYGAPPPGA